MFEATQRDFATALLDPDKSIPEAVRCGHASARDRRFAVYRNNVAVGLVDAIAKRFPATQKIVGEEFFRAMARVYASAHPPRSPLLMFYGEDFPDFVAGFEPASELPYLADVVRLEAARTRAFHAADATPLAPRRIESISDAELGALRILPHPSAQIVRSRHPIVTIWAMNAGEMELGEIAEWRPEDALIVRPQLDVFVCALPPGDAIFLEALFAGEALAEAAARALEDASEFDLVSNLAGLISSGVAAEILTSETRG